jgi:hypothetical protein
LNPRTKKTYIVGRKMPKDWLRNFKKKQRLKLDSIFLTDEILIDKENSI